MIARELLTMSKISAVAPSLIVLLFATCGSSASLADSDFLRVSIKCPDQPGNGALETINENAEGNQSRVSYFYSNGRMERVVVAHSEDGTVFFKELFALDRATSETTNKAPAFHGYENSGKALFRFYCFAEPEAKKRYLELLQANRDVLRQLKGG
ncbi:hypothetical protein EH240_05345 [Mesorhizobium tamadayense]|uniref:Uncharacterized protein n=1 Tax=Mesorhizobium tamadayense TaxID=425306 RepID=A0A3P3G5F0_9HYPH|nr:hypothetical protein [Mesorhizobium tamadayense]RRI05957.1 hypothetical protein EH240_05345 [Mesorhizobium tamadayense]